MIGKTISHYKILEKSRSDLWSERGCSFRSTIGTALGEVRLIPQSGTDETSSQFTFVGKEIV